MKKFLYFLLYEDGRYLTVVNGVVTLVNSPVALSNTPDGWQEVGIVWERDMKTIGPVRTFSVPLGFILNSAKILRKTFFSESVERKIFLVIARLETEIDLPNQKFKHVYRKFYRGELDPTTFKNSALKIECAISEGGLHKLYNANKGTIYEFILSEGDADIKLDGINLQQTHTFLIPKSEQDNYHFIDTSFLNKEGEGAGVATFSETGGEVPFNYNYNDGINFFLQTTQAITGINLKGQVKITARVNATSYRVFIYRTSVGNIQLGIINNPQKDSSYTFDIDYTFDSVAGEKFYMTGNWINNSSGIPIYYDESNLKLSIVSRYRTTRVKAYTPALLFKKLVKAIFGSESFALSNLLDSYSHLKITSGDGVRGLSGAKIKTSFNDFNEFCHVILASGFGIENKKVRIEAQSHFLNSANPIPLGEAKDAVQTEATDLLFNTIKAGYNVVSTDNINGKFAFNNSHIYKTDITRVSKELTLICPYAADPYAIELTRINLDGKSTTDNNIDNQNFVINAHFKTIIVTLYADSIAGNNILFLNDVTFNEFFTFGSTFTITNAGLLNGTYTTITYIEVIGGINIYVTQPVPTGVFTNVTMALSTAELFRPAMTITGVPDPATIYNIVDLTPKEILKKHLPYINSVLHREAGSKIKFQTTEKNADLVWTYLGVTTIEKSDETVGTVRLFLNYDLSFETIVPTDLAEVLELTPNQAFSFIWEGVSYDGFIRKAGMAPTDEKEQTFKLLSAPLNDFKKLIHE